MSGFGRRVQIAATLVTMTSLLSFVGAARNADQPPRSALVFADAYAQASAGYYSVIITNPVRSVSWSGQGLLFTKPTPSGTYQGLFYDTNCQETATPNSSWPTLVNRIRKAGERAASLTKQLLAFSRKQVIEPKPLSLNTTLCCPTVRTSGLDTGIGVVRKVFFPLTHTSAPAGRVAHASLQGSTG